MYKYLNLEEIFKWKWMVLGALRCMNNSNFNRILVNNNIVIDVCLLVYIICLLCQK